MGPFSSIEELVRAKTTDLPVMCLLPEGARAAAREFVQGFPGEVLYAVKANPERRLLGWLLEGGVAGFDAASIAEIGLVRACAPKAGCYFNHPVKPRRSIAQAYREHGVRDFVVDHAGELDKVLEEAGRDVTVEVRIAADSQQARVTFGAKFGAAPADAVALLRAVKARGAAPAICMHVGYQTANPAAFEAGMNLAASVMREAAVAAAYLNVGGGFPSVLMPRGRHLRDFFARIRAAREADATLARLPLKCEPGSALAHPAAAVLAQVLAVNRGRVYLNDGVYGALFELLHTRIQPPTRILAPDGTERDGAQESFTVFGPTCDSYDTIPVPFTLPAAVREGDWLVLAQMGAYSSAAITDFNGLGAHETAVIGT
jgi:ornithine decarboxylase